MYRKQREQFTSRGKRRFSRLCIPSARCVHPLETRRRKRGEEEALGESAFLRRFWARSRRFFRLPHFPLLRFRSEWRCAALRWFSRDQVWLCTSRCRLEITGGGQDVLPPHPPPSSEEKKKEMLRVGKLASEARNENKSSSQ